MRYLLNFSHPVAPRVLALLAPCEQIMINTHLDLDVDALFQGVRHPMHAQVVRVVDRAERALYQRSAHRLDGTVPVLVVLPGLAEAAAIILTEIHGRLGVFPTIITLRRSHDGKWGLLGDRVTLGTLDLQKVRGESRSRRLGFDPKRNHRDRSYRRFPRPEDTASSSAAQSQPVEQETSS